MIVLFLDNQLVIFAIMVIPNFYFLSVWIFFDSLPINISMMVWLLPLFNLSIMDIYCVCTAIITDHPYRMFLIMPCHFSFLMTFFPFSDGIISIFPSENPLSNCWPSNNLSRKIANAAISE